MGSEDELNDRNSIIKSRDNDQEQIEEEEQSPILMQEHH